MKMSAKPILLDFFLLSLILLSLSVYITRQQNILREFASLSIISNNPEESAGFRNMYITEKFLDSLNQAEQNMNSSNISELLAVYMLQYGYTGTQTITENDIKKLEEKMDAYKKYDYEAFRRLADVYAAVLTDLEVFPVPLSNQNKKATVSFENSWLFERNYGGSRGHEGTDLMPAIMKNNYYPVISMTEGMVEKVGWLEKGGYRIGIRSTHGGYFYYAHLSSYAKDFQIGDHVKAGEMLGFMGNTGYGPEGTTGKFDTHLHLGIYIKTEHYDELSVNPYWILKYMEYERMYYNF